jgi:abequosyltransferase
MSELLFSICIPSYNRPKEIRRLLDSIDCNTETDFEIVICEDNAPKRDEVRAEVEDFTKKSQYKVRYIENEVNLGYDRNLKALINAANGHFILFMGDDDMFIPEQLDKYVAFLSEHQNCGYILRSYRNVYADGSMQYYRYFTEDKEFPASDETYMNLFNKSVFISGFTMLRNAAKEFETDDFDGSLLYQLYLLAEVCRKYPSAYFNTPITQSIEGGVPYFGSSESEKGLYTPGTVTIENSVNFMRWYIVIVDYISKKYGDHTNETMKLNMSKYSYPALSIQRKRGRRIFYSYFIQLKNLGFGKSIYFYIYFVGLYCFGEKFCDSLIKGIKKLLGRRPNL